MTSGQGSDVRSKAEKRPEKIILKKIKKVVDK